MPFQRHKPHTARRQEYARSRTLADSALQETCAAETRTIKDVIGFIVIHAISTAQASYSEETRIREIANSSRFRAPRDVRRRDKNHKRCYWVYSNSCHFNGTSLIQRGDKNTRDREL